MAPIVTMVGPKTPGNSKDPIASDVTQNIKVFVRCRPLKDTEKKNVIDVFADRKEVRINESKNSNERYNSKTFTFDNTFGSETTQLQVYRSVVEPLIEQVVMGYNCTVFAYGQTGTGKTYTMEGERSKNDSVCSWEDDPSAGIIPRALHQLFETLQSESSEHTVRVSFLELYNEELYDLLSAIDDTTKLKIFEDSNRKGSVIVGGLEEITVQSKAEIYEILKKGSAKRQTAATLLNACSSRSHTIFSVTVHIKENAIDGEDLVKIGKLNLVDLAGSENIGRSGAIDKRAREAGNINQSLLTLGRVITSLVDRTPHIPYRESKLTRLLQESLGGRTKTSIIATISPNICDSDDTLSTLEYAQRAKKITNKPEINQKMSKKTLLKEYTAEIERLRRDLAACREKNGIYVDQDNFNLMEQQLKDQTQDIEEKTAKIQAFVEELARIQSLFDDTKEELEVTNKTLAVTSNKLIETKKDLSQTQTDRDEQKHLVEVHLKTEKVLSSQAKELLSVTEVTTTQLEKLHQKVDRQKDVVINNSTKTEQFKDKFLNDMKLLEDLVSITTSSCNDNLDEMQTSIEANITTVEGVIDCAKNKFVSLNESITGLKTKFSSLFLKDRILLEQSLTLKESTKETESTVNQAFIELISSVETILNAFFEDIEKINQIVGQQRQDIEDVVIKQNTHIEKLTKTTISSFEAIKKDLKTAFDIQNQQMSSLINQIEASKTTKSETEEAIDRKIEISEDLMKNLLKEFNDIKVQRIKAKVDSEKLDKQFVDSIEKTTTSRMSSLDELSSKVDASAFEFSCDQKVGLKYVGSIDELNSETTQQLMNQLNELNSKNKSLLNLAKEQIDSKKQEFCKQMTENHKIIDQSITMCDKQITAKQTVLKELDTTVTEGFEQQNSLVTDISQNVHLIMDCVVDKTSEIKQMSQTMEKSQIREIENRSKNFESFVKNDLIEDIPTGTTPQKTSFSFPRDLVETSPHQRILERFRLINASNTPLPESEENDSELLSSTGSSNSSLQSLLSNDENSKPLTDAQKTRQKVGSKLKTKRSPNLDLETDPKRRSLTPRQMINK